VRLPIAGQVVQRRRAASPEAQVLGEVVVVAVRVLVSGFVVQRMRPDSALDVVQPGVVGLMMDVDVARVLVRGGEQIPPLGLQRPGVLLGKATVQIVLQAPLARRRLEVDRHVAVVHPAVELVFLPAAQQAGARRHAIGEHADGRQIADLVRPVVLHIERVEVAERAGHGKPLGRRLQPQWIGETADKVPVAVLRRRSRMEQEQHLVRLVLAAAQRKISGIPAGKQADLDRAVLVGRERFRKTLPEVRHADGQPPGRAGHVEPPQRPLAGRSLDAVQERAVALEAHIAVGPRMKPRVPVSVPAFTAAGVLIDLGLRLQASHERLALGVAADTDAGGGLLGSASQATERQAQDHLVEEHAVDAADVGIAGVAGRSAPAVIIVLQRKDQFHASAAGVEVVPRRVLQHRRVGRTQEASHPDYAPQRSAFQDG